MSKVAEMKSFVANDLFGVECWFRASGNNRPAVLFKPNLLSPHGSVPLSELVGLELLMWPQKTLEGFGHHWQADLRNECFFFSLHQMGRPLFLPTVEMF